MNNKNSYNETFYFKLNSNKYFNFKNNIYKYNVIIVIILFLIFNKLTFIYYDFNFNFFNYFYKIYFIKFINLKIFDNYEIFPLFMPTKSSILLHVITLY